MMVLPPVAAAQAGQATGGGLLDTFKDAMAGATGGATGTAQTGAPAQTDPGPKGDGSVGLFDGVWKKALFGGAAGAAMGFLPFIPGGPILGGVVGALGGAAMGVFGNWRKMSAIKQENAATLGALGVQTGNAQVQQVLESGQVGQLIPMMQQGSATQTGTQTGVGQSAVGQTTAQTGVGQTTTPPVVGQATTQTGPGMSTTGKVDESLPIGQRPRVIQTMTDPETGITQTIDVANGVVVDQAGNPVTAVDPNASAQQSPMPTQGGGAINPNTAVDPGVAPALRGGGGSAGDVGRPAAPAGVNSGDVSAIAPAQAGVAGVTSAVTGASAGAAALGTSAATDATGATDATAATRPLTEDEMRTMIDKLQKEIDALKAYIAARDEQERLASEAAAA